MNENKSLENMNEKELENQILILRQKINFLKEKNKLLERESNLNNEIKSTISKVEKKDFAISMSENFQRIENEVGVYLAIFFAILFIVALFVGGLSENPGATITITVLGLIIFAIINTDKIEVSEEVLKERQKLDGTFEGLKNFLLLK